MSRDRINHAEFERSLLWIGIFSVIAIVALYLATT